MISALSNISLYLFFSSGLEEFDGIVSVASGAVTVMGTIHTAAGVLWDCSGYRFSLDLCVQALQETGTFGYIMLSYFHA